MAFLVKADLKLCREIGAVALGHIPGIWSSEWTPETEAIEFLIAKGTGRWLDGGMQSEQADWRPLSANTMLAVGYDLTNFFDWCDHRSVNWKALSYRQLLDNYQVDMLEGNWSRANTKRSLSPSTVNRRMLTVCEFLTFAAHICVRPEFKTGRRHAYYSQRGPERGSARVGSVRQHPKHLRLPSELEVERWLSSIKDIYGQTPYMMAKAAVKLGLRASEICYLREDQLPSVPLNYAEDVKMTICFATKGGRRFDDESLLGKQRSVRIPVDFLKELHGYRSAHRKLCVRRFRENNPGEPHPPELFLSKHTGRPLSYSRFYEIWKSGDLPYENFSPHLARHLWACNTLIRKVTEEFQLSSGVDGPIAQIALTLCESLIPVWISPQLGHVDEATSQMYLACINDAFGGHDHLESWWDFLNDGDQLPLL